MSDILKRCTFIKNTPPPFWNPGYLPGFFMNMLYMCVNGELLEEERVTFMVPWKLMKSYQHQQLKNHTSTQTPNHSQHLDHHHFVIFMCLNCMEQNSAAVREEPNGTLDSRLQLHVKQPAMKSNVMSICTQLTLLHV